jgi:hypothetical protein
MRTPGYFRITPDFADALVREGCAERMDGERRIVENFHIDAEVLTAEEMKKVTGTEMWPRRAWGQK